MASSESAFFREILAMASAGHMASVVRAATRRKLWLAGRAPLAQAGQPYGRLPLYRDARGEIMLAGWQAGERCAPHDHADARGMVIVVDGTFTETRYQHQHNNLRVIGVSHGKSGSALPVTQGLIHDLRCDERGATLHVYLPAIESMRVYDGSARVTWIVDDAAGAWIPRDTSRVIAAETWTSDARSPAS